MEFYPPHEFFDKIIERCPKASFIYARMWRDRKDDFTVSYDKSKINHEFFMHWKKFKSDLRYLKKEKVLNYCFSATGDSVVVIFSIPQSINEKVA